MSRPFYYLTEPFVGDPAELAESLSGMSIRLRHLSDPCTEFTGDFDRKSREIGDVAVYEGGRIVAWACSDAPPLLSRSSCCAPPSGSSATDSTAQTSRGGCSGSRRRAGRIASLRCQCSS